MSKQEITSRKRLREPYVVLWIKNQKNREGRQAAAILRALVQDYSDLGEFRVIEVKTNSIGEELPFVAMDVGILRGLEQIKYFADSERRIRVAEKTS